MPKGKDSSLGRAILKDKAAVIRSKKQEMREKKRMEKEQIGLIPETGLKSVLDVNNLDDFLDTVNLSQRNFQTEWGSAVMIDREVKEVKEDVDLEMVSKYKTIQIPRRPLWDSKRTPEEQDRLERTTFLEWRRFVAKSIEHEKGSVAPFEKNLEVWRQLWRVVEKSDVLVQIVDSRNPLLFRCPDVDKYVKEVHPMKRSMLIVNKADLIPEHVRIEWGRYFDSVNLAFVFFSAKSSSSVIEKEMEEKAKEEPVEAEEAEEAEEESESEKERKRPENAFASLMSDDDEEEEEEDSDDSDSDKEEDEEKTEKTEKTDLTSDLANYDLEEGSSSEQPHATIDEEARKLEEEEQAKQAERAKKAAEAEQAALEALHCTEEERQRYRIHNREEILATLERETAAAFADVQRYDKEHGVESGEWAERRATVGMLGFPNVGKSSLINVLLGVTATSHGAVRVAVGATPGKTKHLQTCILSDTLMLCDCPGLVFPVVMNTKADLLFNGVLPASNMREYIDPIRLVCQRVPREELERVYHIKLPRNPLDPPNAVPHPRQLLQAFCTVRGYMASNHSGVNEPRGAIAILKDVLNGVLTWWIPPPSLGVEPTNPIATIPEQAETIDPSELTKEQLKEIEEKKENGGRHKPRERKVKERSGKKSHKVKKAEARDENMPQYQSKGAYQYI